MERITIRAIPRKILVRTGQQNESAHADAIVDDLDSAIKYILKWKE